MSAAANALARLASPATRRMRSPLRLLLLLLLSVTLTAAQRLPPCSGFRGEPDCYALLGVAPTAALRDIKKGARQPEAHLGEEEP